MTLSLNKPLPTLDKRRVRMVISILLALVGAALLFLPVYRWAVPDAVVFGTAEDCRAASGACWAFIRAKARFILFAFYPGDALWRPALVIVLLLGLMVASALPRVWGRKLLIGWPLTLALSWWLMIGGGPLRSVSLNDWGGLPVTLLIWVTCMAAAFPSAVLLALARQSRLTGLRVLSVAYVELMRAIPFVAVLYFAMLILPMALPAGVTVEKIFRAAIMTTFFIMAYLAEVVRGGLQTIGPGQAEAAASLGFGYWRTMQLIVLPQALRQVIPGLVNIAIGFLLATSLLGVIGVFDLLNTARASTTDRDWLGFFDEAYIFVAVIYFLLCFGGSRYSLWLESRLRTTGHH